MKAANNCHNQMSS